MGMFSGIGFTDILTGNVPGAPIMATSNGLPTYPKEFMRTDEGYLPEQQPTALDEWNAKYAQEKTALGGNVPPGGVSLGNPSVTAPGNVENERNSYYNMIYGSPTKPQDMAATPGRQV